MEPTAGRRGVAAGVRTVAVRRAVAHAAFEAGRLAAGALEEEWQHRRLFLWLPVAVGTGVCLYFAADAEPVLWLPLLLLVGFAAMAVALRHARAPFVAAVGLAAVAAGFVAAELRAARVAGPLLARPRIVHLAGRLEEVDPRRQGARFVLRVEASDELPAAERPARVRLTTRRDDPLAAGDRVAVTARLLPPAAAALRGEYAFARDAYFAGLGAVGSLLGRVRPLPPESGPAPTWPERAAAAVDRARNALAARVDALLGGDTGAIGAAMVTGKRDRLSEAGREIIREAGIFHIITIAGVQMTLVAGLLFGLTRRLLALSPTLALRRPIKKVAALVAMAGAVAYDVMTGSRVGTERALLMTLVMLGAVLADRRGFTMRNLALAALAVLLLQPEAVLGASFQLSFAAVAALVAVYEARQRRREAEAAAGGGPRLLGHTAGFWGWPAGAALHLRSLALATMCATAATASFMAAGFHEISPYVLIGNPVTLAVIEFFAVPGALLGSFLYPLGLDAPVWSWIGLGIGFVMAVARTIGGWPGATLTVPAFAPWALPALTLAVLSAVLWRTVVLRLTALPLALVGLLGATLGPRYELIVAPDGGFVASRTSEGRLALTGKVNPFAATQWLRADGDGRLPGDAAAGAGRCDPLACVVTMPDGQTLSLVSDPLAFAEDCRRADVVVTPLQAPASCAAPMIVDRDSLAATGAIAFTLRNGGWVPHPARSPLEDRPWSPAPRPQGLRTFPLADDVPARSSDPPAVDDLAPP